MGPLNPSGSGNETTRPTWWRRSRAVCGFVTSPSSDRSASVDHQVHAVPKAQVRRGRRAAQA
jgi:hypothetical protein